MQYILECVAFQMVFLIVYDFFLRKETFFQWNRLYLLGTHLLSLFLPLVKVEGFKTFVPVESYIYPEFLWNNQNAPIEFSSSESIWIDISWQEGVFVFGALVASTLFAYKMGQLYLLRKNGQIHYFTEFTQIMVSNSNLAFSFFKSIFLGDKVVKDEYAQIIQHELVHIRQKHSLDLLLFELLRIVCWFNPLVYLYQSRISELHEFVADAQVAKTNKKEQYQLLLSQVFQTKNISFVNQFFNSSLIKKRIVMLQKSKSKKVWHLKYLLLAPIVLGMMVYSSCESEMKELNNDESGIGDQKQIEHITKDLQDKNSEEIQQQLKELMNRMILDKEILSKEEYFKFRVLNYKTLSKPKIQFYQGDTLYFLGNNATFKNPTNLEYEYYVNRTKAFQVLDLDLWVSIDHNELAIRKVEKEDKNLGPGEFILVENVSNLTGEEIRKINRLVDNIDFNTRFLFISDNENAFLITKVVKEKHGGISGKNQ